MKQTASHEPASRSCLSNEQRDDDDAVGRKFKSARTEIVRVSACHSRRVTRQSTIVARALPVR